MMCSPMLPPPWTTGEGSRCVGTWAGGFTHFSIRASDRYSAQTHSAFAVGHTYMCLVAQLCSTICDSMDCSLPGSSVHVDSPGKNTGVHFLLQCMKVKSESEGARSCPTLSDPMDCSPPGSSIHGIFQARVLEWGAIEKCTDPGVEPASLTSPALAGGFFTTSFPWVYGTFKKALTLPMHNPES